MISQVENAYFPEIPPKTGVLLSGGLDSCILLETLLNSGRRVCPIYIRSDCFWEPAELQAVGQVLDALDSPHMEELVTLEVPVADLYEDHWSMTGVGVPDGASAAHAVRLPGRNALLAVKAALWCQMHDIDTLALATLCDNPFPDAGDRFFDDLQSALTHSEGRPIRIVRPFADLDKRQVMELADRCPLEMTFSCLSPVEGRHCGDCNKCTERQAAFESIGRSDPTEYANKRLVSTAASGCSERG